MALVLQESEVDDQFERLSQEIEVKINEGLTHTLSQFENRLESALESLRQTVSASIGARSHAMSDQESDLDQYQSVTEAQNVPLTTANFSTQNDELHLGPPSIGHRLSSKRCTTVLL